VGAATVFSELKRREASGEPIQVGLIGAGAMGLGIAHQIGRTPGMRLSFIADKSGDAAREAAHLYAKPTHVATDGVAALNDPAIPCDVLVEATNSIVAAFGYCMAAIEKGAHCVLMNAEIDAVLGYLLRDAAARKGVVVTSDAGDQHGVLARMAEEVEMWGFDIVQAGNMKGFLDRYRTLEGSVEIASSLRLSPEQCLAYTDGSKLNIEMSLIANERGLTPRVSGMEGPKAERVEQVLDLFDFDGYGGKAHVDYILGARQHGGGVYVVARSDDPFQRHYLDYYKIINRAPYCVFFRPYHLCHFETPRAIAMSALYGRSVLDLRGGRMADCYAYAKRALSPGDRITHAIGSDEVYGLIMSVEEADADNLVPQGLLDIEESDERPVVRRAVERDQPLTWDDIDMPDTRLLELWRQQEKLLAGT
jgi:predicted homoserine dehydrogenase-like protein